MHSHAPENYVCPFCVFAQGRETEYNKQKDIIYKDSIVTAWVAPKWWVHIKGNVLVIPNKHYENVYDIPEETIAHLYKIVKKLMIAIKETYQCDGTSTRQHNESAGGQEIWHFHTHIFPRYTNDNLYQRHNDTRFVISEEKDPYVKKLRDYLSESNKK